jgi:uncharacterized protein YqeY
MADALRARLERDLKTAMLAKDEIARDTIRFILASVKNQEIEQRSPLSADDDIALLNRMSKRLLEAIEQYDKAGRTDLSEREREQLAIVKRYLPEEMTDDELNALVQSVVLEVGAVAPKDMGKVMPVLLPKIAGRADGKRVSAAVRQALAS